MAPPPLSLGRTFAAAFARSAGSVPAAALLGRSPRPWESGGDDALGVRDGRRVSVGSCACGRAVLLSGQTIGGRGLGRVCGVPLAQGELSFQVGDLLFLFGDLLFLFRDLLFLLGDLLLGVG